MPNEATARDDGELGVAYGGPDHARKTRPKPLTGWTGKTAHPKSPGGGGGPGGSTVPGVEKADSGLPATRTLDSSKLALAASGGGQKTPPVTVPMTKPVASRNSRTEDIDVQVQVLADTSSSDSSLNGAKTKFDGTGVTYSTPGYNHMPKGGRNIVTEINGVFELKGTIVIQTVYGPGSKANDRSLYGRGTTKKDKARKNTSLGFHESCHRNDFLRFLAKRPLPTFTGRVGQSEKAFKGAVRAFEKELKKYWVEMDKYSLGRTDEVGYKRSKCLKSGKC